MKLLWYSCSRFAPIILEKLRQEFLRANFERGSINGFQLDQARPSWIEGKYFERINFVETVTDPFGNNIEISRVRFDVIDFRLSTNFPELQIKNSPKTLREIFGPSSGKFLGQVAKFTNFTLAIEWVDLELVDLIESLTTVAPSMEVRTLTVENLPLADGITGRMSISGERDVRRDAREYIRRKHAAVRKIGLRFSNPRAQTDVFNTGRATVATDEEDEVAELLRRGIKLAVAKTRGL